MGIVTRGKGNKYLRLVVPRGMRSQIGRRDIFKSLRTDSAKTAERIEKDFNRSRFLGFIACDVDQWKSQP